jgi:hypothetical protein
MLSTDLAASRRPPARTGVARDRQTWELGRLEAGRALCHNVPTRAAAWDLDCRERRHPLRCPIRRRSDFRRDQLTQLNAQLAREVMKCCDRAVDLAELDRRYVRAGVLRSTKCRGAESLRNAQRADAAADRSREVAAGRWRVASAGRRGFLGCRHRARLVSRESAPCAAGYDLPRPRSNIRP